MDAFSITSVQRLYLMNILQIPAITIFFYDWALTLGDEAELIWSRKDRPGFRILLATLRIAGLGVMCNLVRAIATQNETENLRHISTTIRVSCMIGILILVQGAVSPRGAALLIMRFQVILQIRVYAIYNASRAILWTNAALFVLEWGATLPGSD